MNYKELKEVVLNKGFKWFSNDNKPFNINIVSIRKNKFTNKFDDTLYVAYPYKGKEYIYEFNCTTSPGSTNIKPNTKVALLKEGQYSNYTVRLHNGRYTALCQKFGTNVPVERYSLVDGLITKIIDNSLGYGINIHRSSKLGISKEVNKWSLGCTVLNRPNEWLLFEFLILKAKDFWGNKFTYTLIDNS